jgi:hypothetical protein
VGELLAAVAVELLRLMTSSRPTWKATNITRQAHRWINSICIDLRRTITTLGLQHLELTNGYVIHG